MEILNTLQQYDSRLFTRVFRQGERRMVIPLARAVSHSADGYLHAILVLLLFASGSDLALALLQLLTLALFIERSLYFSLKNGLRRRRPEDAEPGFKSLITASDQFSFPSGHTSGAFLLVTSALLIYGTSLAPLYMWSAGVALSRVLLGVHYPGDTLAGAAMGSLVTIGSAHLLGVL